MRVEIEVLGSEPKSKGDILTILPCNRYYTVYLSHSNLRWTAFLQRTRVQNFSDCVLAKLTDVFNL